ncbi:hypothetical protein F1559_004917 [Cyanidiococcus yangmingshanensis]|uniref:Uncharacterized protein n=1 Tax=Cyanidiococcus yangmingshanensis TaxID=2690220 RepID=A0A7J7IQL3_9RHOD|nr:hypothetical protein F1559_004917 [Cyanidiococcus yangmingshanensis]
MLDPNKGMLIYEKPKAPLIRLLGVVGVFQVAAWATFGMLNWRNAANSRKAGHPGKATSEEEPQPESSANTTEWFPASRYQTWWPAGGLIISLVFLQLMAFYARRNVKSIRLMGKCAERARVVTHSLFRSGREDRPDRLVLEVPTARLVASASARASTQQDLVTFGVRGYGSYFQVDRKRGQVHDASMLDALTREGGDGVIRLAAQRLKERTSSRLSR